LGEPPYREIWSFADFRDGNETRPTVGFHLPSRVISTFRAENACRISERGYLALMDRQKHSDAPPVSTQTGRVLPSHTVRTGSTTPTRASSKVANVEGPIMPGTLVTQRFQRNGEGALYERKVAADLILLLDAVVESKGYTAKIRVNVFDAIWTRYDAGDYGSGKAGNAVYDDIESLPTVWLVDADVAANPAQPLGGTHGPQRIVLATATR
jgi:hypothetical protein